MSKDTKMPLSDTKVGQKVSLLSIDACDELRSRLAAMGMVPNVIMTIVSNGNRGPFVVNVKGSKIVLGRGMAHKVMVENIKGILR